MAVKRGDSGEDRSVGSADNPQGGAGGVNEAVAASGTQDDAAAAEAGLSPARTPIEAREPRDPRYAPPAGLQLVDPSDPDADAAPQDGTEQLLMLDEGTPGPPQLRRDQKGIDNRDIARYLPAMQRMANDPRTPRSLRLLYSAVIDKMEMDERQES